MMNIVSGKLRGLPLRAPAGMTTRPTSVRARKALFDSLGDLTGKTVADLFAGSGAIGLEAASRGAGTVWFADSSPGAIRCIKANTAKAAELGCNTRFEIVNISLPSGANRLSLLSGPDLVFADPPYADSADILPALTENEIFTKWADQGKLYWEFPPASCAPLRPPSPPWKIAQIRNFGAVRFLILEVF